MGNDESHIQESFDISDLSTNDLVEFPQYTRPADFEGYKVTDVLLSGNHKEIAKWRLEQSKLRTAKNRPDLLGNSD